MGVSGMKSSATPDEAPVQVVLYSRAGCHLCVDAKALLAKHQARFRLHITEVDIDRDPALQTAYGEWVPVIVVQGRERFRGIVNEVLLMRTLQAEAHTGN